MSLVKILVFYSYYLIYCLDYEIPLEFSNNFSLEKSNGGLLIKKIYLLNESSLLNSARSPGSSRDGGNLRVMALLSLIVPTGCENLPL